MAENRLELDTGYVRAHAEVLAEPECQVRIRPPIDAENEWICEHILVAVGRRPEERQWFARGDLLSANLAVLFRRRA